MRYSFRILFALLPLTYLGQVDHSNLIFKSTDGVPFNIKINDIVQFESYERKVNIVGVNSPSPLLLIVHFEDDTTVLKENIFLLDEHFAHIFNVSRKGIELKKIVSPDLLEKKNVGSIVSFARNKNLITAIPKEKDSVTVIDTSYTPTFTDYYKLEGYKGPLGCPFPIKDDKLVELKDVMLRENLDEIKLEKLKQEIQDMDSLCIMVNQIKELVAPFQYDDMKLDLLKYTFPYSFDIGNYKELEAELRFEYNKDELREFIKKTTNEKE